MPDALYRTIAGGPQSPASPSLAAAPPQQQEASHVTAVQAPEGVEGEEEVAAGEEPPAPEPQLPKRSLLEAVGRSLLEPSNVVLRDKFSFVLGVANLAGEAAAVG